MASRIGRRRRRVRLQVQLSSRTATASSAPPTPFNFYVNRVTDTQVSMQWSPGYLTEPTRWRVYQNDQLVATRIGSSYLASGLVPGGSYSYYVVAVDQRGDVSAPTRTITVTTRGPGVEPGGPADSAPMRSGRRGSPSPSTSQVMSSMSGRSRSSTVRTSSCPASRGVRWIPGPSPSTSGDWNPELTIHSPSGRCAAVDSPRRRIR